MTSRKSKQQESSLIAPSENEDFSVSQQPHARPEAFYGMSFRNVQDNLILSLDAHGMPLSRLSDSIWILTQFKLVINDNVTFRFDGLTCDKATNDSNIRITKTLFLMRLFSGKGNSKKLRAGTLSCGFYSLLYLCRYADDNDILISELLYKPAIYRPMLEGLNPQRASALFNILRIFNITKCPSHWFAIPNQFFKDLKKIYFRTGYLTKNQHPVIPPRILNLRWSHYCDVLNEFTTHRNEIEEFIRAVSANRLYGRSLHAQYFIKRHGKAPHDAPTTADFDEAVHAHGLSDLFVKFKVSNVASVPHFLMLVQYCAKALIHILTLMRSNEAILLERDCIDQAVGWSEKGVYVVGLSTKATGKPMDTKWITIEEVNIPLKALAEIYDIINPYLDSELKKIKNLFVSPSHIGLGRNKEPPIIGALDSLRFESQLPEILIEEEDILTLELISPERNWRSEKKFQIGNAWKITTHQFRRTMTVYCAEDSLMEIGPLQRVLVHLSKVTTEHYQKGCSVGVFQMQDLAPEIVAEFKRAAIDASFAVYIRDILNSKETLHGLQGRKIKPSNDASEIVLSEKLGEVLERKRKGLVACTITPIGLCQSIDPCERRAHADFSTCDGCKDSIIKLSKLDYVIEVLRFDLQDIDPSSLEYKMDFQNLQDLEKMKDRLIAKSRAPSKKAAAL